MGLKKEIEDNQVIVAVIPNREYSVKLMEIVKVLAADHKRICYVSLNKPFDAIIKILEKSKIDSKKFCFIDCITQTVKAAKTTDRVLFISSPRALTDLSIAMTELLKTKKIESLFFDSLSTLLVYESASAVIKFAHAVMAQVRVTESKGVFTVLKEDVTSDLIKDMNMFADRILDFGEEG